MTQNKKILLATGGTGGHVFPAIALGDFLQKQGHKVAFSTDARGAKYFAEYSFDKKQIQCASPTGNPLKKLIAIIKLGLGFLQSLLFVWKYDVVIGFGGYASFAPILVAKIFGKKIILHEQNAVLGKVNRVLQKFASHVATSFPTTNFASNKAKNTGSFVRDEFEFSEFPAPEDKIKLLIIGGSQGAKIFSDLFPKALAGLNVEAVHQVPESEVEQCKAAYDTLGITAEIKPFFTDIKERIEAAHLVISRAGASSILELTTIGRPAIFIPLKNSADNHQYENARELAEKDAAWLVQEGENLAVEVAEILQDLCATPSKLVEKAKMMHTHSNKGAKAEMLKLILEK